MIFDAVDDTVACLSQSFWRIRQTNVLTGEWVPFPFKALDPEFDRGRAQRNDGVLTQRRPKPHRRVLEQAGIPHRSNAGG